MRQKSQTRQTGAAMTHDDPHEITDGLIEQHGLDGAIHVALENAATAGDNYSLSVWREVKAGFAG